MGFKKNHVLICTALFLAIGRFSYAQSENDNEKSMAVKIDENSYFFDALRLRSDLRFQIQKRVLFTTIGDIEAFHQKYKDTEMTLEYVIRDRLHTAIFLHQKKKYPSVYGWIRFWVISKSIGQRVDRSIGFVDRKHVLWS